MPITRRDLLSATGIASTLALRKGFAANDRIQIGCIGFGIMGQGDVKTAAAIPGVELVAIADVYQGRLTLARERYGDHVFTTRDHRELLARSNVDAVIVATPDHWHARISNDAMNAGKDVYCQKPMVQKAADGHTVIDTQKKTGRILQVGSQCASSVLYAKAKEVIKSGAIGEVHLIESFWNRNSPIGAWQYSIPPDASEQTIDWDRFISGAPKVPFQPVRLFRWRNYRDYGTGIAGDLFVHQFTGIHFVMNSVGPQRVSASGGTYFWKDGRDVPDLMMGMYDYAEANEHPAFQVSLRVNFEAGTTGGADSNGFRFIGTDGVLNLSVGKGFTITTRPRNSDPGTTAGTFSKKIADQILEEHRMKYPGGDQDKGAVTEENFPMPPGYSEQVAHHVNFYNAVRSRSAVVEDPVFGLRAAGPALLSNISYFERRTVEWDPVKMQMKS